MLNLALSDTFLKCLPENYLDHVRAIHGYFGKSAKRKAELKGLSVALRHELAALAQSVDDACRRDCVAGRGACLLLCYKV